MFDSRSGATIVSPQARNEVNGLADRAINPRSQVTLEAGGKGAIQGPTTLKTLVGIVFAFGLTRFLASQLFGVQPETS